MTGDAFGPVPSLWTPCLAVARSISEWGAEYLAAFERQAENTDVPPGTTPAPRSVTVRHAAVWRPGEQTPAIVVWPAGVTDHTRDPDGFVTGTLQLGVWIIVAARDEQAVGDLVHRYAAAIRGLLIDHQTCGGHARRLRLVDEDYTGIDVETRGRTIASADLSYEADGVLIASPGALPAGSLPREDPLPPWPPVPTVETVHLDGPHPIDPDPEDP